MTAAADTTTQNDAAARLVLAALDPGTFGQTSETGTAQAIRRSSLYEAEKRLEEALAMFEHLDERGLCDDAEQLVEHVKERLAAEQEDHNDKKEAA